MPHFIYRCSQCNKEFEPEGIEKELVYLCPICGSSNNKEPLRGVLEILYDYERIKKDVSKVSFLGNQSGRIDAYPYLWPLKIKKNNFDGLSKMDLENLVLNSKSVSEISIDDNKLYLFDDSRNLTLSYKDRASILVCLKALQMGIKEISAASTGNAGSSLAGIAAKLGLKAHIFVPKSIPENKRIQISSFGANIYVLDGDYDESFDLCLEVSDHKKWYNRNTGFNPLTIEGKKSSVYDMFIQLGGELPRNIFVSAGDGVIISGIFKGLIELIKLGWIEELPKLNVVQSEGSDAIIRYLELGKFDFIPAETIADSICAGAPRNLYMAANCVKSTKGRGIRVTDEEILQAQKLLAMKGILSEPAAAASLAGYLKLSEKDGKEIDSSMIMNTGNGLKDISALTKWNIKPPVRTSEEIKEILN